ncbi:S9 family peptidase [Leptolyngbya sp. NIES-2104]|uniref:S9 family peptidase n=1 Tax=Leptolyngbya sp. NIES-2104 TaxID=1552121 RepID=UPI0006ECB69C|nr:S9 family peptidase [Leptolyngbya sp. NIES-2104]GAP93791.1 protease II [Leptolyngbya sp. NIES-2104]
MSPLTANSHDNLDRGTASPPIAAQHRYVHQLHDDERIDDYFWLRERDNPEVIAYLEAENAYTEAIMQHTESLQTKLYEEMLSRIQEDDLSVPYRWGEFYYYTRTESGKAYPIHCRKPRSLDAPEEVLLDQNELAQGNEYFSLGVLEVSPSHQILAYSTDTTGAERYTLFFLDLTTRKLYSESIPDTASFAWGNDNQTVFYAQIDSANRPYKLFRHQLDSDPNTDELLFHEADDAYFLGIDKTRSEAYLLLGLGSKITSEVHYLDANNPTADFRVIRPRQVGIEYEVEHHTDTFYILTNENALNFKLMKASVNDPKQWETVIEHREDVFLMGVSAFTDHLVIYDRESGVPNIRVRKLSTEEEHTITFPEPTYEVSESANPDFNTKTLRFGYTSLVTPGSIFDYDLDAKTRELKKETPVLGGYDRANYKSERLEAIAPDGAKIPLSIVYKAGIDRGSNPLLMTGYGSYGFSYPDSFSSARLALLDRGVILAIAHIRGGSELGRKWYEDGKFLHKQNTFSDFIACAETLIQQGWTDSEHLAISGGSAGGLLIGAVINQRPELFKSAIAQVPFVDVVTTILDDSLPLTVTEWEEWGNPSDREFYFYMKSYSPYDNVAEKAYPALLITAGLNDPRVSYWEPAKWTAKLRALKTDSNVLLLKTNMGAGHGGASGRYERLKEIAFEYAFLLDQWQVESGVF